jgi:hypothetical protein
VLVRTIAELPTTPGISGFAAEAMEDDPHWDEVDPRGFVSRWVDPAPKNSVFVLVSQSPRMVQVRFGRSLVIPALREGVQAGPGYRAWQDAYAQDLPQALVGGLTNLSSAMQRGLDAPWYVKLIARSEVGGFVLELLDEWLGPGDGFFTRYLLEPTVRLVVPLTNLVAPLGAWAILFVVALAGFLLELLGDTAGQRISRLLRNNRVGYGVVQGARLGWKILLMSCFGAALMLVASGRWEDGMALMVMGAPTLDSVPGSLATLAAPTALWLAALAALAMGIVNRGEEEIDAMTALAGLPDEAQQVLMAAFPKASQDAYAAESSIGFFEAVSDGDDADDVSGEEFELHPFTVLLELRKQKYSSIPLRWLLAMVLLPGFIGAYILVGQLLRLPFAIRRNNRAERATLALLKAAGLLPLPDDGDANARTGAGEPDDGDESARTEESDKDTGPG